MRGTGARRTLLALSWVLMAVTRGASVSRCSDRACSPPLRNLAAGRTLVTLAGCSSGTDSLTCPEDAHPPAHMTDDPFLRPGTWWASGAGTAGRAEQDGIRLDLERRFYLSHVLLVFRSPRPAAMAVERSADFGRSWEYLKVFARNCSREFGLPDDAERPGSLCTSRYTGAEPCSGGEVILRILDPGRVEKLDPYSPEALVRLTLTNLRIRLLEAQTCPSPSREAATPTGAAPTSAPAVEDPAASAPYAVYTLLVQGTCQCHGHAEDCAPLEGRRDANTVSGRCVCVHHTAGDHCQRCAALYNDRPWRPANGSSGDANPCRRCECHGHADSCHFSRRVWLSTGGASGGVCDGCRHNTAGRRCQRCRHGYHRRPSLPRSSPRTCQRCRCDPRGSLPPSGGQEGPWCHPRSGRCHCKPGVGGASCSRCQPGFWGFGADGCQPCGCPRGCDPATGRCPDSYASNQVLNVPIGGKIPDLDSHLLPGEEGAQWSKGLAVSTLHYTGRCSCKEKKLRSALDLCKTKHDYVMRASVLSAHDKGSHAEVRVAAREVLRSGPAAPLRSGTVSVYPLSWTSRGCTCPILNPGMDYLLAGPEEAGTGRLLVTMQSVVVPWTPRLGLLVSEGLRNGCP